MSPFLHLLQALQMLEVGLASWLAFLKEMTLDAFIFCKEKVFDDADVGTARGCQGAQRHQLLDFGELCHLKHEPL